MGKIVEKMSATTDALQRSVADRYIIERELGRGGMATVYLARDLKHDRKVALKVLKPELAAVLGAERFLVEIKTTAALQHPHILPLFDSGTADGMLYYVMPYIQGETIREKLNRETQLPVPEAIRIAQEVADALGYAHRHGVIHRDIKPENILLHDGRAMVMDFGIALAVSAAAGGRMTETGLSLGTPHYMSPEQATAEKDLTPRSDIYSLASVLYEMLAGTPPHVGGSAQQIIMHIITDTPRPVSDLRKSVPPNVAAAIAKGLEKVPADRFENAKAFSDALGMPGFSHSPSGATVANPAPGVRRISIGRRALIAGVAVLALAVAGWAWLRPVLLPPTMRLDLTVGPAPLSGNDVSISPDGSMLAYSGLLPGNQTAIFLRRLTGEASFRLLAGTEGGTHPGFSPDNQWIVFHHGETLARISVSGGGLTTIVPEGTAFNPHWGTPEQIVYSGPLGVFIVPAAGGTPRPLPKVGGRRPFLLPDGSGVLGSQGNDLVVYDLRTDSVSVLVHNARHGVYAASGHLLYVDDRAGLSAVPFDLKHHRVTGAPARLLDRVAANPGARGFSVSNNGTLVQHDESSSNVGGEASRLVIHDFDMRADTLPLPRNRMSTPRFSPNGKAIVYAATSQRNANQTDLFTYDIGTRTTTQITFDSHNHFPVWSPDGTRILYSKDSLQALGRLHIKAADNSGTDQAMDIPGVAKPTGWPRDDLIMYTAGKSAAGGDLMTTSPKLGAAPRKYLTASGSQDEATLSPDGKFVAFSAREDAQLNIWLRDFPTPLGKWKISPSAGNNPRWAPDGKSIYYVTLGTGMDTLMRVQLDRTPSVIPRTPVVATTILRGIADGPGNWDLHPDGKHFIVAAPDPLTDAPGVSDGSRFVVTLNWFTELKAATKKVR